MVGIGALITALVPLAQSLMAGASFEGAIGALSLTQWGSLAAALANLLAPEVTKEFEAHAEQLDPHIATFVANIIKHGPDAAAKMAFQAWTSDNANKAMQLQPGMGEH